MEDPGTTAEVYKFWDNYPVEVELSAILNEEVMIIVDDQLYKFLGNGIICSVDFNNSSLLASLTEQNFTDYLGNKQYIFYGEDDLEKSATCKSNHSSQWLSSNYNYSGRERRIRGRSIIRNVPNFRYVKAETELDEKRNGNWRNWRTSITAHTAGAVRPQCEGPHYIDEQNLIAAGSNVSHGNRSSITSKKSLGGSFRVKSSEFGSIHTGPSKTIAVNL